MSVFVALLVFVSIFAGYLTFEAYVRFSMRSYGSAERAWVDLSSTATNLLESEISQDVARAVVALTYSAGCGCFVSRFLISRYLPMIKFPSKRPDSDWEKAFKDLEALPSETRAKFSKLMAIVFVYDSFRKPIRGWLFRQSVKTLLSPEPSFPEKMEADLAAWKVISQRGLAAS